jgi:hypothetical protein
VKRQELSVILIVLVLLAGGLAGQTKVDLRTQGRNVDFGQMNPTRPVETGTILPATCNRGEMYFLIIGDAGQSLYLCGAPNVWTAVRNDLPVAQGVPGGKILATDGAGGAGWTSLAGDATGAADAIQVMKLRGMAISATPPVDGEVLKWDASGQEWKPGVTAANYTAGLGLIIAGETIAVEDAIVPFYLTGLGAPTADCVPGRDMYTDLFSAKRWFCATTNTWQELSLASHTHTTAEVAENGNLYFTTERARASLSAAAPLSFNSTTGEMSCSGCEVTSAKGAASGYASLDANTLVPAAQLGSGTATSATYLAGNNAWKSIAASEVTGLAASATVDTTDTANITSGKLGLVRGGTAQDTWTAGRCVQVSSDGTALESAGAACGPGASITGDYTTLTALTCNAASLGLVAVPQNSDYHLLRCDGAGTWQHFVDGKKVTPPSAASWSWVDQGTATVAFTAGTMDFQLPAATSTTQLPGEGGSPAPPPPWALRALVQCGLHQTSNACGLLLREQSTGRLVVFGLNQAGSNRNHPVVQVARYTTTTTAPTVAYEGAASGSRLWLSIQDDGTNRIYSVSSDGRKWKSVFTEVRTTFLIPTEYGAGGEAVSTVAGPSLGLIHWEVL